MTASGQGDWRSRSLGPALFPAAARRPPTRRPRRRPFLRAPRSNPSIDHETQTSSPYSSRSSLIASSDVDRLAAEAQPLEQTFAQRAFPRAARPSSPPPLGSRALHPQPRHQPILPLASGLKQPMIMASGRGTSMSFCTSLAPARRARGRRLVGRPSASSSTNLALPTRPVPQPLCAPRHLFNRRCRLVHGLHRHGRRRGHEAGGRLGPHLPAALQHARPSTFASRYSAAARRKKLTTLLTSSPPLIAVVCHLPPARRYGRLLHRHRDRQPAAIPAAAVGLWRGRARLCGRRRQSFPPDDHALPRSPMLTSPALLNTARRSTTSSRPIARTRRSAPAGSYSPWSTSSGFCS